MATEQTTRRSFRVSHCAGVALALLALAGVYGVAKLREAGRRTSCLCNLMNLSLALTNYESSYGSFPPAFIADSQGRPMHSWRVLILPYLDRADLYERYRFDEPWDGPNNIKLLDEMPRVFACPSHSPDAREFAGIGQRAGIGLASVFACGSAVPSERARRRFTSYTAVFGPHCMFRGSAPVVLSDVRDGLGATLLIGEVTDANIPWTKPEDIDIGQHPRLGDRIGFRSEHNAGVNFGLADGRPRCIRLDTPQQILDGLYTRDGGETIPGDL